MPRVEIEVGVNGAKVNTGLARLENEFGHFRTKIARKFSGADLFKGLAAGLGLFGAEQIAERITEPFRQAAEFAKQTEESIKRAADASGRTLTDKRSPEQNLAAGQKEFARQQQILEDLKKKAGEEHEGLLNTRAGDFGMQTTATSEAEAAVHAQGAALAELGAANDALKKQIEDRTLALNNEMDAERDRRAVIMGRMREEEAGQRQLNRLTEIYHDMIKRFGIGSVNAKAAHVPELRAENQQLEISRKASLSLSASSLAKIGGGGNVFSGGGPAEAQLAESRKQTALLERVAANTASPTGPTNIVLRFRR